MVAKFDPLIRLIGLFWLIIIVVVIYGLIVEHTLFDTISGKIQWYCLLAETAGIYAVLALSNWKHSQKLVESFNQIEIHSEMDGKTYHRLRNTIIIANSLLILTVTKNLLM